MLSRSQIIGLSAAVLAFLLFGNKGFRDLVSQSLEKRRLQRSVAALRQEHEALKQELSRIRNDPAYTEYLIRKKLGYVKPGEIEYHFEPPRSPGGG